MSEIYSKVNSCYGTVQHALTSIQILLQIGIQQGLDFGLPQVRLGDQMRLKILDLLGCFPVQLLHGDRIPIGSPY